MGAFGEERAFKKPHLRISAEIRVHLRLEKNKTQMTADALRFRGRPRISLQDFNANGREYPQMSQRSNRESMRVS